MKTGSRSSSRSRTSSSTGSSAKSPDSSERRINGSRRARSSKAAISLSSWLIFSIPILLPRLVGTRILFRQHSDNEDVVPSHIIEHPVFPDTQPELGGSGLPEHLDPSPTLQGRVDGKVPLDLIQDRCTVGA